MYLVINNKSRFYQLVYFRNGKRTSVSTGTSEKSQAEKFLTKFQLEQKLNSSKILYSIPQSKPNPENKSILLSQFIPEYKSYIKNTYSEKYLTKAVTPSFNRFTKLLPDLQLNEITAKHIDHFISSVYSTSKFAAALYYRTLKAAFNKALVWNYITENPFNKIKSPKLIKTFPVYINESELNLVQEKIEDQLLKDIVTTAFYTGMRLNEILNMKWDWIDVQQNIITVKNSVDFKTKSKRERIIPIHQKVNSILKGYSSELVTVHNDYIFKRNKEVKLNSEFISKQFKKTVRLTGLNENIHFHSLRHSFASALVQRNVSIYSVKELLGHENIKTTQVYSHLQKNNLLNAINRL